MELVYPPAGFAALFPDGTPVTTATGFGSLSSNHCAIGNSQVLVSPEARSTVASRGCRWPRGSLLACNMVSFFGGISPNRIACRAMVRRIRTTGWRFTTPRRSRPPKLRWGALPILSTLRTKTLTVLVPPPRCSLETGCGIISPRSSTMFGPYIQIPYVNYFGLTMSIIRRNSPRFPPPIGGRLNRFVNLPAEWQTPATCALDRVKVEALAFASGMRNLDLSREAVGLFPSFGWPVDRLRYLVPVFGFACPWNRELALAHGAGITTNNLGAFDHICLFNLDVPEKALQRRSFIKAA